MKPLIIIDIDNTLANTNKELETLGFDVHTYPSKTPIPRDIFSRGDIFQKAQPMVEQIDYIERMLNKNQHARTLFLTARPNNPHVRKTTKRWLGENVSNLNTDSLFFTNGFLKGDWLERHIINIKKQPLIVFDDAPHEIKSYFKLKDRYQIPLDIHSPKWAYNRDITDVVHF